MNGRFSAPPFREGQLLQVRGQLLVPVERGKNWTAVAYCAATTLLLGIHFFGWGTIQEGAPGLAFVLAVTGFLVEGATTAGIWWRSK